MPGPLPEPHARRRNAPTIPTTSLPAGGRKGAAPRLPKSTDLGTAGLDWWKWAWKTPQAAAWSAGDLVMIARRASLEDDLTIVDRVESLDFGDVLEPENDAAVRRVVGRLAALCVGRLAICREMRELDDRLGLTPKGLAQLRWKIVADVEAPPAVTPGVPNLDDRRSRSVAS